MTPQIETMMRIDEEIRLALKYELPKEIEEGGDEDVRKQTSME